MGVQFKETLRNLCSSNGWSYAVLWRVKCPDSMLLKSEDAYFEDRFGIMTEKMLQQIHVVGEGIVGQVAITGKHRWIFSDSYQGELSPVRPSDNQTAFQDIAEWHHQFSAGIQTIVIISVPSQGVIQFGSTQKIVERLEFVDHIRSLFRQLESISVSFLSRSAQFNNDSFDPHGTFASVISPNNTYSNHGNSKGLHDNNLSKIPFHWGVNHNSSQPSTFAIPVLSRSSHGTRNSSELLQKVASFTRNSSLNLTNRCQTASAEAQVILSSSNLQLPQVQMLSSSSSSGNSVGSNTSMSTCSSKFCALTSEEKQGLSEIGIQVSSNMFSTSSQTIVPCGMTFSNLKGYSNSAPSSIISGSLDTVTNPLPGYGAGKMVENQHSPLFHVNEGIPSTCTSYSVGGPVPHLPKELACFDTLLGEFQSVNTTLDLPNQNLESTSTQWTAGQVGQVSGEMATPPNEDLLQALGIASPSSSLVVANVNGGPLVNDVARSFQNPVSCSLESFAAAHDGNENVLDAPVQLSGDEDLFDSLGLGPRQGHGQEPWNDIPLAAGSGNRLNLSTSVSECISGLDMSSITGSEKGFFSESEIEQLLDAVVGNVSSVTNLTSDDQSSTTTITRAGSTAEYSNQVSFTGISWLSGSMDSLLPPCKQEKINHGSQKDMLSKSLVNSWIDGSYSVNAESVVTMQPKRHEEPAKVTRKRARPGESIRPRPKDRQQIQDRVKELREIVPNGAKCSIDSLLDRTIKHMLFLQSVTKYADKLKQVDEPKMIDKENGVVLKDNSNGSGGGATWAFEVGGQTMVCPIIVEDLNLPGQMLVEMLCEERGFFLEIADIIRGFGLTILKGVMEVRDNKIWARFVVEANRDVTRMDIFLSLVQLLQQTTTSGIGSSSHPPVVDNGTPVFANCQQSPVQLPISLPDRLQ